MLDEIIPGTVEEFSRNENIPCEYSYSSSDEQAKIHTCFSFTIIPLLTEIMADGHGFETVIYGTDFIS